MISDCNFRSCLPGKSSLSSCVNQNSVPPLINLFKDHSFSTFAKRSDKLTFLTPWYAHMCAYQGIRNVSLSENFAHLLIEWSLLFFPLKTQQNFLLDLWEVWNKTFWLKIKTSSTKPYLRHLKQNQHEYYAYYVWAFWSRSDWKLDV